MEATELQNVLYAAMRKIETDDRHLLEHDVSERCIAARLALYRQPSFLESGFSVDVEYNRAGAVPKRLGLPDECANYRDDDGESLAVPDVIVHRRGATGPNLLVIELKKTTNGDKGDCDRRRLHAFREHLHYGYGAFILCETRPGRQQRTLALVEWIPIRSDKTFAAGFVTT